LVQYKSEHVLTDEVAERMFSLFSEDEFIDDPYFGRRIKTYGGGLRLGNKRIDNREKILREKSELKRKRQLEKMSRSSQRLPTRGGVSRM
jgi:hypothetical protein